MLTDISPPITSKYNDVSLLVLRSDSRVTSSTEAAQRSAGEQNCQRGQFCSQSFEGITGTWVKNLLIS